MSVFTVVLTVELGLELVNILLYISIVRPLNNSDSVGSVVPVTGGTSVLLRANLDSTPEAGITGLTFSVIPLSIEFKDILSVVIGISSVPIDGIIVLIDGIVKTSSVVEGIRILLVAVLVVVLGIAVVLVLMVVLMLVGLFNVVVELILFIDSALASKF